MDKHKYTLLSRLRKHSLSRPEVYAKVKTINKTHSAINELLQCGLISQDPISGSFSIRPDGIHSLEQEMQRRSDSKRYWVTTIIAILALIISGFSLLSELGLLRLPKY